MGLPVLRTSPLCTCCHHYPGTAAGLLRRSCTQPYQPSPKWRSGRPVQRPFRGLLSVHSRYGLHTRWITFRDPLHRRLQLLRHLHNCSDCFRLERNSRAGFAPTGKTPPCHGARQERSFPSPPIRVSQSSARRDPRTGARGQRLTLGISGQRIPNPRKRTLPPTEFQLRSTTINNSVHFP